jgi:hypothetical protein
MIKTAQDAYLAGRQLALQKLAGDDDIDIRVPLENEVYYEDSSGNEMPYDISVKKKRLELLRRARSDILNNTLKMGLKGIVAGGLGGAYLGYTPRKTVAGATTQVNNKGQQYLKIDRGSFPPELDTSYLYKGLGLGAGLGAGYGLLSSYLNYNSLKNLYGKPGD